MGKTQALPFLDGAMRHGALPVSADAARVEAHREALDAILSALPPSKRLYRLIDGVVGNSPFLTRAILKDPERLARLMRATPEQGLTRLLAHLETLWREADTVPALMAELRRAKQEAALLIALADLAGVWDLEQVTGALSDFAQGALQCALRRAVADAAGDGRIDCPDPERPEHGCGLTVLAMGKFGARELNYSSDIDLVVFFDSERLTPMREETPQQLAVAFTRAMAKMMQEVTAEGYVFRVDLRLRPDAGSTQAAVSFAQAEQYYAALGQNWERAAFIKARPVAGDDEAGRAVMAMLASFIWRRNLDYAAIEDIHSIKRQIHAQKGYGSIAIEGHNVKLGRGGIREIEFFAQTQQLIHGGRVPELRISGTVPALRALAAHDFVSVKTAEDLITCYRYFRRLEHRLQMVEDLQTHSLPRDAKGVRAAALFMGEEDEAAFRARLSGHLERVQHHYAALFESEPALSKRSGSLVFTGVDDDPDTIETLRRMGFAKPSMVTSTVRGWHHGRLRATRNERARALLTKLIPALLDALAETNDPDGAFLRFDRFLSGLPYGVQVFSLLHAHPELMALLAEVLGTAPRVAGYLSRNPGVLESMLDPAYVLALPGPAMVARELDRTLEQARDFEDRLNLARIFARAHSFRISLQMLIGKARASVAGMAFTALAECVIRVLKAPVRREMEERHGRMPGGGMCVVAMGKMGSSELTATSDLDLICIYDVEGAAEASDGPRPLAAAQYYARFSQRLINALTAPTADGKFYEVDMRLRPSGRAGPIATSLEAFERYHREDVWTWERMALTRARVVAGPPELRARVGTAIRTALSMPMDPDRVRSDAADMRARLESEFGAGNRWNVKTASGGLTDIDFIAQTLQLIHGPSRPDIFHPDGMVALARLAAARVIGEEELRLLLTAARLQHNIAQLLAIAVEGPIDPSTSSRSLQVSLARVTGSPTFAALDATLGVHQAAVRDLFVKWIGPVTPA